MFEGLERVDGSPVREDPAFQVRAWIVERIGWSAMGLLVVAGLLGAFANGPLSWTEVSDGTLSVRYERILRDEGNGELEIRIAAIGSLPAEVVLSADFLASHRVMGIEPEPAESKGRPDGSVAYRFDGAGGGVVATIDTRPRGIGPSATRISGPGGSSVELHQFTLP
jgi:hypothetical protein